ncbi:MAG: hypothetical protein COU47_03205 [Candidatus Niyogibacteria bacterium CG10_big_fil_rev_8_21_14_0_10_46_36]|uniref:DUF306 domain-containing protein n=1 Tax=Candidatus Niyogibacteria bacterium CG10_big_fil_rev_8_21_14_0_10_46_36 TaxID=1974726 RepID=A0A2H0TCS1_9BACT|nr:MAG: hypothetical protein COU47_03205 [Candidatus Niyogibacteria bacterium CG10_big_fil_rev_8_21_14_0_10_46_36]
MKTFLLLIIIAGVVIAGGLFFFGKKADIGEAPMGAASPKDATYIIEDESVTLTDGVSEVYAIEGSAAKTTTRYFGNEVYHDFNGDGREDVAFLLTQETGGSGTFFYVAAALNTENGYVGSRALFLGDRIAPQSTHMSTNPRQKNVIVVNYADRAPDESFTDRPSVGKSIWLILNTHAMQFGEVVQDFEGEANLSMMSLDMKKWLWMRADFSDGREIIPKEPTAFTISFSDDSTFSATTDCNSMSGSYETDQNTIMFKDIAMTKIYCEGSQEGDFAQFLTDTIKYHFTSHGELILELASGSGTVTFR